jgi:hypothetical protein
VDLEDPLLEAREGPALDGEEQNEPSSKTADGREVAKENTLRRRPAKLRVV